MNCFLHPLCFMLYHHNKKTILWQGLAKKSLIFVHDAGLAVISFVFQRPPSIPPIQTVYPVASEISCQMALTQPDVFPLPGLLKDDWG